METINKEKFFVISKISNNVVSTWNDKKNAEKDAEELKKVLGPILICKVVEEVK